MTRLESLIALHNIHNLSSPGAIDLTALIEGYWERYSAMPYFVQAMTVRWQSRGETQTIFMLNDWLSEPESSAQRRHARAHEFAHLFANHRGSEFIMWGKEAGPLCEGLETFIHSKQEHQCESISSVLLVPMWMLKELDKQGADSSYVAGVLDVPEHLVGLRWAVYERFGR